MTKLRAQHSACSGAGRPIPRTESKSPQISITEPNTGITHEDNTLETLLPRAQDEIYPLFLKWVRAKYGYATIDGAEQIKKWYEFIVWWSLNK